MTEAIRRQTGSISGLLNERNRTPNLSSAGQANRQLTTASSLDLVNTQSESRAIDNSVATSRKRSLSVDSDHSVDSDLSVKRVKRS